MNNTLCKINTFLLVLIMVCVGASFYFLNHKQDQIITDLSINIVNASHRNAVMLSQISKFLDHKLAHMSGGKFEEYVEPDSMKNYPLKAVHATPNDFLHQIDCERCDKMIKLAQK